MSTVNPWKRFIGLLPGGTRTVGTVASVDLQNGTSIITLRNGSQISAKGTSVGRGLKAFVVDGQVMGQAPGLVQYEVEV
ncbi:hypothetical protein SAMN05216198_1631 [Halopseudomonas litoralis]|uniref:Uncharacterized protein n=1 Tax=Halopseudomonas litoralis TaxID=797277 RepID=A0A1H1R3A6_9GAMM|nr:hypothetical protein [Halopseudomonas litoralis]SDS29459.1 hypothetical protein SAMN05216198_1631 [Halopseudomonas litoralis]